MVNGSYRFAVQAATRPAGGRWQPAQELVVGGPDPEKPGDFLRPSDPQVAVDAAGDLTATWLFGRDPHPTTVQAAIRPASSGWQQPQNIGSANANAEDDVAPVALDAQGDTSVVWNSLGNDLDPNHRFLAAPGIALRTANGAWQPAQGLPGARIGCDPTVVSSAHGDVAVACDTGSSVQAISGRPYG
jgi:hypothetical protein